MRLRTLTSLERQKIEEEYAALQKTIADLKIFSPSPSASRDHRRGLHRHQEAFRDERRTRIVPLEDELNMLDVIPDTPVVVTSTVGGYIKTRFGRYLSRTKCGGRGVTGIANLKREDVVQNFFMARRTSSYCSSRTRVARIAYVPTNPGFDPSSTRDRARESADAAAG